MSQIQSPDDHWRAKGLVETSMTPNHQILEFIECSQCSVT